MLEYEIPFVCLIFTSILILAYALKKKIELEENYFFTNVIIFSLIVHITNFVSHYGASIYLVNGIDSWYAPIFAIINKVGSLFIVAITTNVLSYILYISFKKYRVNFKKFKIINYLFLLLVGILIAALDFNVIKEGSVTSGTGSAITLTFAIVFLELILAFIVSLTNIKKYDKRYYSIYIIIPIIGLLGVFVMYHPEFNIYDLILSLLCYLMYFTIDNPDLVMIEKLKVANEDAARANKAKTDFLSSMSHEIRTPLNAIVGFSECIKNEDSLDKAKEDAEDIITASQNLLEIVNGILDISKIESGKMELVEKEYDLHELAENLAKLIKTRIGEKQITLNTYFAPDIPGVLYGDAGKVRQVMSNVLTNAVKYTEKGFIDFSISCVNDGNTSKLVISVEDTGRGIKPEKINKLFNKFERLEEDKNTTLEGTGLGLAISKSLVEMMNGKIVVQSKYGEGSKFTIYIPQVIKSYVKKEVKSDISSNINLDLTNRKILIVDDNKLNLKIEARSLEGYHPTVTLVESGFETLEKIKNGEKYDLILMDDMMPKMSGTEAMKQLRTLEGFKTPIVVLTANAISGMKEKYLEDGFDDYLAKPLDKEELKRVLTRFLSGMDMEDTSSSIFDPLPSSIYTITDKDIEKIDALMPDEELRKREEALNAEEKNNQPKENKVEEVKPEEVRVDEPVVIDEPVEIPVVNNSSNKGSREFLEQNGVNVSASLELLGDMEMFDETIDGFIKETEERIPKMKEYKDSNNTKDYAILAHAMKSDSKYLGFTKLAELSLDHELKGKEDNIDYINENYDTLIAEVDRIMSIIKEYRG